MLKKFTSYTLAAVAAGMLIAPTTSTEASEVVPATPVVSEFQPIAPHVIVNATFEARTSIRFFADGNIDTAHGQINAGARITVLSGPHGSQNRWRARIQSNAGHNGWATRTFYFSTAAFHGGLMNLLHV